MRVWGFAAFLAATAFIGGCAAIDNNERPSLGFGASTYSASSPSASTPPPDQPLSVAHREATAGTLVVRPDLLTTQFRFRSRDADVNKALGAVEARVADLARRLKAASGDAARVRMTGVTTNVRAPSKKGERQERDVVADGCIEVPLGERADYWARAKLVVALDAVMRAVEAEHDRTPDFEAAFETPRATIKNPEAFRDELVKRWMDRVRGFTKATESATAKLDVIDCGAPPEVTQEPLNLEEVSLTLRIACRVDDLRDAAARR